MPQYQIKIREETFKQFWPPQTNPKTTHKQTNKQTNTPPTHTRKCVNTGKCVNTSNREPSFVQPFVIATMDHNVFLCDSNRGPIVPFVIGPRFECVYLLTHSHSPMFVNPAYRGLLFVLPLFGHSPHWICTRKRSEDVLALSNTRIPFVKVLGLNG